MSSTTGDREGPQASSPIRRRHIHRDYDAPTPREIARARRRIKIARAVALVARSACDCTTAARSVGLTRDCDVLAIRDQCDQQRIPRKHPWGSELRVWGNVEPASGYVRPRGRGDEDLS